MSQGGAKNLVPAYVKFATKQAVFPQQLHKLHGHTSWQRVHGGPHSCQGMLAAGPSNGTS